MRLNVAWSPMPTGLDSRDGTPSSNGPGKPLVVISKSTNSWKSGTKRCCSSWNGSAATPKAQSSVKHS